jgi:hypothetical protein
VQPPSILIDGLNLLNSAGGGIASYAFGLATALRESGCNITVLFGQRGKHEGATTEYRDPGLRSRAPARTMAPHG